MDTKAGTIQEVGRIMITVDYFGRTGNQLFQFFYALIFASKYDIPLATDPPKTFLKLQEYSKYTNCSDITAYSVNDKNCTNDFSEIAKERDWFHLHGYFQLPELYNEHRKRIKECIDLPPIEKNTDDIVIHLRLTDYWWSRVKAVIHPDWYLSILRKQKYRKLYIVCEDHNTNHRYLQYFSHIKNKEVVSQTPAEDFHFIRSFNRIICSNSTFCWWATFLSDASKIWTFKDWMGPKHPACKNLAYMAGATVVPGPFMRDRNLEVFDWTDYWKK